MTGGDDLDRKESPLFIEAAKYAALAAVALSAGMAAAVLLTSFPLENAARPAASAENRAAATLIRHAVPQDVADIAFADAKGQPRRLSEWRGRTVLLNLWATWCAPCKTEMPSLDRLQAKLGGRNFEIIALSTDRGGLKEPAAFFASQGITHLKLYNDATGQASTRMKAAGLPSTLVLNGDGEEIARLVGPADWDSPAVLAQIEALK